MDTLLGAVELLAALTLIAASFMYIFNPRQGRELLKRLAIAVAGLAFAAVAFRQLGAMSHADGSLLLPGMLACLTAYIIVKVRRRNLRQLDHAHGRERMSGMGPPRP